MRHLILRALVLCLCTTVAFAQQFQHQSGLLPGPVVWSEGVETLDANGDGKLDIIFANGLGFSSGQGSLLPTLLINTGTVGAPSFVDETSLRIPTSFLIQGKGIVVCDVDSDGDTDMVFANGFQTQQRILINNGLGFFSDETVTRLPQLLLGGFGVACGDVDNDGDLDLVFTDTGPAMLSAPGGLPRLLINNGSGVFTDAPAQMNGVAKIGAMQASMVDVDNDFDLDIIIDGRSLGTHLYINNGSGTFTFNGTTLPAASTFVYESDWADLDNDNDIDGFFTSLSSFNEGSARNNLNPSGVLSFTAATNTLSGLNGNDDNEIAFLDANNDGVLDVIVASLSGSREKLYLNSGTFAASSFVYQTTGFTTLSDSTLDLAIADFDGDGRYDVVTAQGESGNFTNRYYRNTGLVDTIAPRVGRVETLPLTLSIDDLQSRFFSIRAWIQDAVIDSGRTHVKAFADITITKDGNITMASFPMTDSGGQMWRFGVPATSGLEFLIGATIAITVRAEDPAGNITLAPAGTMTICGAQSYGSPSNVNALLLDLPSTPPQSPLMNLRVSGAAGIRQGYLVVGLQRDLQPLAGGTLLVSAFQNSPIPFLTDGTGAVTFALSVPPGILLRAQAGLLDTSAPFGWFLTNGLEFAACAP
jgi:hypothetical protein